MLLKMALATSIHRLALNGLFNDYISKTYHAGGKGAVITGRTEIVAPNLHTTVEHVGKGRALQIAIHRIDELPFTAGAVAV